MTSRDLSIFNTLRPFSIGFDDMFDQFENMLGNGNLTMLLCLRFQKNWILNLEKRKIITIYKR